MKTEFKPRFSKRAGNIPESFIREILKVTSREGVISFAGGLPNPELFPVEALAAAAEAVLRESGRSTLQYSVSEGYLPLREWIAERYSLECGFSVSAEEVLIVNGSQQGLDLLGKIFLDPGSRLLMEEPSYLGAIQAFSAYEPEFSTIPLLPDGPDMDLLEKELETGNPAFLYAIPDFQNPSGYCYSPEKRLALAALLGGHDTLLIEDGAYREICFGKEKLPSLFSLMPERTVHLGSFSKVVSPGMRLGYAIGPAGIIRRMCLTRQAGDLHSNFFAQRVLYRFLTDNSFESHLAKLKRFYRQRAEFMSMALRNMLPEISFSEPEGGMFIWAGFPDGISARAVLAETMKEDVVFVPGNCFYLDEIRGRSSARLNFSNPTEGEIEKGFRVLKKATDLVSKKAFLASI